MSECNDELFIHVKPMIWSDDIWVLIPPKYFMDNRIPEAVRKSIEMIQVESAEENE